MDNWSRAAFVAAVFEAQLFLAARVRVNPEATPLWADVFRDTGSRALSGRNPVRAGTYSHVCAIKATAVEIW
jgi:hypothetical protein